MTTINLAPTTKEALTEKLRHYFQTLGNLNELNIEDGAHIKHAEGITSAFIDTLTKPTPASAPPVKHPPIGYVVLFRKENGIVIRSTYMEEFYETSSDAERAINAHTTFNRHHYIIHPVHTS